MTLQYNRALEGGRLFSKSILFFTIVNSFRIKLTDSGFLEKEKSPRAAQAMIRSHSITMGLLPKGRADLKRYSR